MRRRRDGHGDDPRAPQLTLTTSAVELERLREEESRLLLAFFWSAGCEPCRVPKPELERLAGDRAALVSVVAVDVDAEPDAAWRHAVTATPTLGFFKAGEEIHRFRGGALPASVKELMG